jgi:membrane protease subunit (stomatin/prohibitin family)
MKKSLKFQPESHQMIVQVPRTQYKKGEIISVPPGYEALIIANDMTAEVIQNRLEFKLDYPVEIIYFVKSNRNLISTKWGTKSRLEVQDDLNKPLKLGAYGTLEFQLISPHKLIQTRLSNGQDLTDKQLIEMVLSELHEALNEWSLKTSDVDKNNLSDLMPNFKVTVKTKLDTLCDSFGVNISKLTVESINLLENKGDLI